jgi:hypothetical protein
VWEKQGTWGQAKQRLLAGFEASCFPTRGVKRKRKRKVQFVSLCYGRDRTKVMVEGQAVMPCLLVQGGELPCRRVTLALGDGNWHTPRNFSDAAEKFVKWLFIRYFSDCDFRSPPPDPTDMDGTSVDD